MRTFFRLVLLGFFLLSVVLFVHVFAFRYVLSAQNISSLLTQDRLYTTLADEINSKLAGQEDAPPIHLTGTQISSVLRPFLEKSIAYIRGETTLVPSLSYNEVLNQISGGNAQIVKQLNSLKEEMVSYQPADSPAGEEERQQQKSLMTFVDQANKGISFEKELVSLRGLYLSMERLPLVLGIAAIICLFLILLISPNNQGRAVWLGITGILTGIIMGVGMVVYTLPTMVLTKILTTSSGLSSLAPIFIMPFVERLARVHMAVAVAALSLGVIGFLARAMVFRGNPVAIVVEKKNKK